MRQKLQLQQKELELSSLTHQQGLRKHLGYAKIMRPKTTIYEWLIILILTFINWRFAFAYYIVRNVLLLIYFAITSTKQNIYGKCEQAKLSKIILQKQMNLVKMYFNEH